MSTSSTQESSITEYSSQGYRMSFSPSPPPINEALSPIDYDDFSGETPEFESQHKLLAWEDEREIRRIEKQMEERQMMEEDEDEELWDEIIARGNPLQVHPIEDREPLQSAYEVEVKIEELDVKIEERDMIPAEDDMVADVVEARDAMIAENDMVTDVAEGGDVLGGVVPKRKRDVSQDFTEEVEGSEIDVPAQKKHKGSKATRIRVRTDHFSIKIVVSLSDGKSE